MKTKINKIPSIILVSMVAANTMVPAMAQEIQHCGNDFIFIQADDKSVSTQNEDKNIVKDSLQEQPMEVLNHEVFLTNFTLASPNQKVFNISNAFTVSLNGYVQQM